MIASVRAVLVSYQTRDELRGALQALEPGQHPWLDVVVVDNASEDGSPAMVRHEFPGVDVRASLVNRGFAGGINLGLTGCTSDYALVLNPDVKLPPPILIRMLEFMDSTPEAAGVSPLLVGEDGAPQEHLYRRFPTVVQVLLFWTALRHVTRRIGWLRRRYMEHSLPGLGPVEVDQCPGAAILVRRTDLEQVGLWDPGYFIWWEDVDWCYRARQAGRSLYVLPELRVPHTGGASFRSWKSGEQIRQFYRAFYRFAIKHHLDRLLEWSHRILSIDLALKEGVARAWKRLGLEVSEEYQPETFGTVRGEIEKMREYLDKGEVPDFDPKAAAHELADQNASPGSSQGD